MDGLMGDNMILKMLISLFKEFSVKGEDAITKLNVIKLFFEYKLIDTCGYNIFELNDFLHQLNAEEDTINLKNFLILIFYIYKNQANLEIPSSETERSNKSGIQELSIQEVNSLSMEPKQIYSSNNIIKIILNQRDKKKSDYKFLSPDFNNEDIKNIINYDLLEFVSKYMYAIENDIFNKYSVKENINKINSVDNNNNQTKQKEFKILNISKFNTFIFDYPIFKNFDCESITKYLTLFINDIQEDFIPIIKKAFDERLNEEDIKEIFNSVLLESSDMNFSYSGLVILLIQFCLKLKSSEGKSYEDSISFLFENEFNLKPDLVNLTEQVQEEEEEQPDYDFIPESKILDEAKQNILSEKETEFILEVLETLDKALPPIDQNVLSFANDKPTHSNTLYTNPYVTIPAKFPLEKLQVEIDEQNALDLENYEKRRIERAKKNKKRNARDAPPKEIYMEEIPNKNIIDERYMGKPKTPSLTDITIKSTFKEIVCNNKVYPSIIKETLILPIKLPEKIKELVIGSYKDHVQGHIELAIKRLERAEYFLRDLKTPDDPQISLFFNLTYGSYYQDIDLNIQALKYYMNARKINEKLPFDDPDLALVYSYLGSVFLVLKEFEWSFRSYQMAKDLREKIIGGDTLDTAATYNNLGVVSFYMESFLPAKNYLNLAYEITKSILGIMHPRTLLIKSNISKLNTLSFNKEIAFKTLSKYPALEQLIQNPKRKKKGKGKKKKK